MSQSSRFLMAPICAFTFAFAAQAQSISLTPQQNGGGTLPDGYDQISFTISDGDWVPTVQLPRHPRDKAVVTVYTGSPVPVDLDASVTDLGGKLPLARNVNYSFEYSAATGRWSVSGGAVTRFTPNEQGSTIPSPQGGITYYSMWDGNWTPTITLPSTAADESLLVVRSDATYGAQIAATNQLFPSTTTLRTGDSYTFVYRQAQTAWVLAAAPVRRLIDREIVNEVPRPTSPRTLIEFWDGNWTDVIRLPAAAGDRDRITVRSQATWSSRIDGGNVNFPGTMVMSRGDEYQFVYIAATGRWEMTSSPQAVYQAADLVAANGALPAMTRPRTVVYFGDGNYVSSLRLPAGHKPGDRVIVNTSATYGFTVQGDGQSYPISTGEIVSFVVGSDNRWTKETRTIDLLMLYSDKASAQLGENVMRARLVESLGLTNDALENSRTNFRFRSVGLRQVPAKENWPTLEYPLNHLTWDPTVQAWRNQLNADGIYYEGTEYGCGMAWVNDLPAYPSYMVATGSTVCGTTVMRHELGHNMGLWHSEGHVYRNTIMAGNALPFFAAPYLYAADGSPLTPAGGWNEVAIMNTNSPYIAAFR